MFKTRYNKFFLKNKALFNLRLQKISCACVEKNI